MEGNSRSMAPILEEKNNLASEKREREKSLSHELQQREIKFFEVEYLSKNYQLKLPWDYQLRL